MPGKCENTIQPCCSFLIVKKYGLEVFSYSKPNKRFTSVRESVIYLSYHSIAEIRWSFYRHTHKYKAAWNIDVPHSTAYRRNTNLWKSWHRKMYALWNEMLPSASCGQLAKVYQKRDNEQSYVLKGRATDVEMRREFQLFGHICWVKDDCPLKSTLLSEKRQQSPWRDPLSRRPEKNNRDLKILYVKTERAAYCGASRIWESDSSIGQGRRNEEEGLL